MSHSDLLQLGHDHVFDPAPPRSFLGAYHVDFDELVEGARVEGTLITALRGAGRIPLVGASGCGKTSVLAATLGPQAEDLLPILVPAALLDDDVLGDPAAFARHILRRIRSTVREAKAVGKKERRVIMRTSAPHPAARTRTVKAQLGAPSWLFKADVAIELTSTLKAIEEETATQDTVEQLDRIFEVLRSNQLSPVLVMDDTDAWLNLPGIPDRSHLVGAFFSKVPRMVAGFGCALVVAVHDHYLGMEGYHAGADFLETPVHVPRLATEESVSKILARRLAAHELPLSIDDIITAAAISELTNLYQVNKRSLRQLMVVLHAALTSTADSDTEKIEARLVEDAAAGLWI